jgi:hypothetical protein
MKYKTAFRLAVRAIGIFLVAQSLPWFIVSVGRMATTFALSRAWAGSSSGDWWEISYTLQQALSVVLGLYLFFRGDWIVNLAIPSNRPYCHECAYELTGLPHEGACPECGTPYQRPGP